MESPRLRVSALALAIAVLHVVQSIASAQDPSGTIDVRLIATGADDAESGVSWVLINSSTEEVTTADGGTGVDMTLAAGTYEVVVTGANFEGEAVIDVEAGGTREISVAVTQRDAGPGFSSPESIPAGHLLRFDYRGPNLEKDVIFVAQLDMAENRYLYDSDVSHKAAAGPPAMIVAPAVPGQYEVRYFSMANGSVLFRKPLTVADSDIGWRVPDAIAAATEFTFEFGGPALPKDRVFIMPPDTENNRYITDRDRSHKAVDGYTVTLVAPAVAGNYEIRYFSGGTGSVLGRYPISVGEHTVQIDAPRTVDAGAGFEVAWSGPDVEGDFVFITDPDLELSSYYRGDRRKMTANGSPMAFTAPADPGPYEIRYYSKKNGRMVAKRTIVVR